MATILLGIGSSPAFRIAEPDRQLEHVTDDLESALATMRERALRALGR